MRWTKEEEDLLCLRLEQGLTYKEVALELDRTKQAIYKKCAKLGIKSTCKSVSSRLKTHEQYVKELKVKCPTIIALESYKGALINILHKCIICGTESLQRPAAKLEGRGCNSCSIKLKAINATKTHEQYVQNLKEKCPEIIVLDKYINYKTKILHLCLVCGEEYLVAPSDKLKGNGHCGQRNNSGRLIATEAGITYLVYIKAFDLYKIGVTQKSVKERMADNNVYTFESILERYFNTGSECENLEKEWLSNIQDYKINTGLLKTGNTETFRVPFI